MRCCAGSVYYKSTPWSRSYLDLLDPNLRLWDVQDLYGTDPTQEIGARSCRLYGSHPETWARSYRSYISYRSGIHLICLADLDYEVGIDFLDDEVRIDDPRRCVGTIDCDNVDREKVDCWNVDGDPISRGNITRWSSSHCARLVLRVEKRSAVANPWR